MNNEGEAMFIGIDVGGTAIKYGVILRTGEIVKKGQMPTIHEKENFLQSIEVLIKSLQQDHGRINQIPVWNQLEARIRGTC